MLYTTNTHVNIKSTFKQQDRYGDHPSDSAEGTSGRPPRIFMERPPDEVNVGDGHTPEREQHDARHEADDGIHKEHDRERHDYASPLRKKGQRHSRRAKRGRRNAQIASRALLRLSLGAASRGRP